MLDDVLVPSGGMQLDPAVMSTLPPSMQVWVSGLYSGCSACSATCSFVSPFVTMRQMKDADGDTLYARSWIS